MNQRALIPYHKEMNNVLALKDARAVSVHPAFRKCVAVPLISRISSLLTVCVMASITPLNAEGTIERPTEDPWVSGMRGYRFDPAFKERMDSLPEGFWGPDDDEEAERARHERTRAYKKRNKGRMDWYDHDETMTTMWEDWYEEGMAWATHHIIGILASAFIMCTFVIWVLPVLGKAMKQVLKWSMSILSCVFLSRLSYRWLQPRVARYLYLHLPTTLDRYGERLKDSLSGKIQSVLLIMGCLLIIEGIIHKAVIINKAQEIRAGISDVWAALLRRCYKELWVRENYIR